MNSPETHFGVVRFAERRIGYIQRVDGDDLFFHQNQTLGDFPMIAGIRVSFTIGRGENGKRRAENVRLIEQ